MKSLFKLSILTVMLCVVAASAGGQLVNEPPSVNSSYWWTLSDEISPAELRRAVQSRRLSRERLKVDIESNRHDPVSDARLAELSIYINGAVTPELIPLWDAYHRYAFNFLIDEEHTQQALDRLTEWGVSAEGVDVFETVTDEHWKLHNELVEELREPSSQFSREVLAPTREQIGKSATNRVLEQNDIAGLARLSGKSEATVRAWHQAWRRDAVAETSRVSAEALRESMSDSDWQALRRFLLRREAPKMLYEYYSERGFL